MRSCSNRAVSTFIVASSESLPGGLDHEAELLPSSRSPLASVMYGFQAAYESMSTRAAQTARVAPR